MPKTELGANRHIGLWLCDCGNQRIIHLNRFARSLVYTHQLEQTFFHAYLSSSNWFK
ncbi:hypothetical protein [Anabaena sp. CCY 9910]|uniref:hypothetical protein n=1 Tax=Anabaena sp. CCY 9910 TaxID=3103870 RepID=UPI0039DF5897